MSADGLVTIGEDLAIRVWRQPQPAAPSRTAHINFNGAPVLAGEFDPSGRYLFAANAWDKSLHVFVRPPGSSAVEFDAGYSGVAAVAYSADGRFLATGHENGELLLWDAATGRRIGRLNGLETWVRGVAFTPDGNSLVAMSQGSEKPDLPGEVVVFDVASQKIRQRMAEPTGRPWQIALSPDGATVAAACADGMVRLWDISTGKLVRTLDGHAKGARAVAYSPDGAVLASGGFDGVIRLWNTQTGEQAREVTLPNGLVNGLAFTPDGKDLVAATFGATVYALRVADPTSLPRAFGKGHDGASVTVAVLKDGKTVVSAGGKLGEFGEVKVWDLPSGKLLGDYRGLTMIVEALAVAPDGHSVVSAGWAAGKPGELRMWDVEGFRAAASVPGTTTGNFVSAAAASPTGNCWQSAPVTARSLPST